MVNYNFFPWDVLSLGRFVTGTFCPSGRFVPCDVLSLRTFCPLGRFVPGTFCALGRFVPRDVLSLERFVSWDVLFLGRFVPVTFCSWDVLS